MLTRCSTAVTVTTLSLLCCVSLVPGCKSSSERLRTPQNRPIYKSSQIDNCSLITKADVEAALNESCTGPYLGAEFKGTDESDPVTFCSYVSNPGDSSPIKFVDIEVHGVPLIKGNSSDMLGDVKKAMTSTEFQTVSGLGDAAIWRNIGTDTFPVIDLRTFKENKVYLKISILGILNESIALDKAKALASKALAKV